MYQLLQHHCVGSNTLGPLKLVIIQASPFCNLDCDYCYLPNRSVKSRLSLDLLDPIFRKVFASGLIEDEFTVVWHAGEPLAVPIAFYEEAFARIAELDRQYNTKRYKVFHAIQTNATLMNQAWCDLIKKHDVKVGVSIDGPAFLHDAHRTTRSGRGTHARTMQGVALLQRNHIDVRVIVVLTQDALDYADEIFRFFVDHGIRHVGFNIEEVEGIHQSSTLEMAGTEARYRAFMQHFYELTKRSNHVLKVREFEHIRNMILRGTSITAGQFTPFNIINIDHQGHFSTFSPELLTMQSEVYGDFILGHIAHDTFESVCNTHKFQRINADVQAGVALCQRTCEYFALCGGGAPVNKYCENNSFRSAETLYCKLSHQVPVDIILTDIEASIDIQ